MRGSAGRLPERDLDLARGDPARGDDRGGIAAAFLFTDRGSREQRAFELADREGPDPDAGPFDDGRHRRSAGPLVRLACRDRA